MSTIGFQVDSSFTAMLEAYLRALYDNQIVLYELGGEVQEVGLCAVRERSIIDVNGPHSITKEVTESMPTELRIRVGMHIVGHISLAETIQTVGVGGTITVQTQATLISLY